MNSLKYGFASQDIVLEGKDSDQFDALRARLQLEFDLETALERELVNRLAGLMWRLRRVPVFEAALIRARRGATNPGGYTFTISEQGMKDIDAFLEDTKSDEGESKVLPWAAYQGAQERPTAPSVEPIHPRGRAAISRKDQTKG
jgi:hypothetical protein